MAGSEYPRALSEVNKAVRPLGVRFIRDPHGYYYPIALDESWIGEGVYVYSASQMTMDEWVKEAKEQKMKFSRTAATHGDGVQKGQKIRDTKTGITYTVEEVVRPRGGELAYVEAIDRRGHRVKVDAGELGVRYVFSDKTAQIQMVQPWTDAYGNPAQDYMGADGQQMQPLRRRPDYGEVEMNMKDRVMGMDDNDLVTRDEVAQMCPMCASKMQREGLKAVRAHIIKAALAAGQKTAAGLSPFETALERAIADKIRELKSDGTISIGLQNLMQIVRPPSSSLEGAPRGTNTRYYYAEMFRNLCKGNRFVTASVRDLAIQAAIKEVRTEK